MHLITIHVPHYTIIDHLIMGNFQNSNMLQPSSTPQPTPTLPSSHYFTVHPYERVHNILHRYIKTMFINISGIPSLLRLTLQSRRLKGTSKIHYDIKENNKSSKLLKNKVICLCYLYIELHKKVHLCSQIHVSPTNVKYKQLTVRDAFVNVTSYCKLLRRLCVVRGGSINFITLVNVFNK